MLNAKLLKDWIKSSKGGSKFKYSSFEKILVIGGGQESEEFLRILSSVEDIKEYREVKDFIVKANINVFHSVRASILDFSAII